MITALATQADQRVPTKDRLSSWQNRGQDGESEAEDIETFRP